MSKYIIAIDQGTTSTRSCVFDVNGKAISQSQVPFAQIYPQPGWVEHDPKEIWTTTVKTLKEAIEKARIKPDQIAAIGITNQRETVVMWDRKTQQPVYNAIVWQCRRTTETCEKIKRAKKESFIYRKTGLVVDPYFSATKIQWLLKEAKRQKKNIADLNAGTIDTFLLWKLTGGSSFATDVSNASRTMLMNIGTLKWDKELLSFFKVPASLLPQIMPSDSLFGKTKGLGFLPDGIPIHGILGDQQAALFGQAAFAKGDAKCTFGTGSFILVNTGAKRIVSKHKLLATLAWQTKGSPPVYALEGGAFVCGAAVQWLRDGLGIIKKSEDIEDLARSVQSSEGVEFVPALTGLGAPEWRPEARGVITGLTRGTSKAHIARATLEAMALQNADILESMEKDMGQRMKSLRVDGGASRNDLLMQMQADFLSLRVVRPHNLETTVLGAAYMAGLGAGVYGSLKEIEKIWSRDREFVPAMSTAQLKKRRESWKKSVKKA
ncbi:MAG: glycerol kinase GlpK [Bdellovibrionota bacterium]